ncbi:MAG: ATP-binding protein [Cyclobacteriaceae bacterium]|nr:ATP-binding protein [Cyclobacteriaceae bacterium]MCH8517620.1 ATP-binding protein [Cyclobacteriaceae bacterium]
MALRDFIPGNVYPFLVEGLTELNGNTYIQLSDNVISTYLVKAYDFQTEWEGSQLPENMTCYVKGINTKGLPYLEQVWSETLRKLYDDLGSEYAFRVIEEKVDSNTQTTYYLISDSSGLSFRYYPSLQAPKREVNEIFSLIVADIVEKEGNKAYLKFEEIQEEQVPPQVPQEEDIPIKVDQHQEFNLGEENEYKEFKTTIVFPAGKNNVADIDEQMKVICREIAGFLNQDGGILYIGVNDVGNVIGIEQDFPYLNSSKHDEYTYKPNNDGYELKIRSGIKYFLGGLANSKTKFEFLKAGEKTYCKVIIEKSLHAIYLNDTKIYRRTGSMTTLQKGDVITYFIEERLRERMMANDPIIRETKFTVTKSAEVEEPELDDAVAPAVDDEFTLDFPELKTSKTWFYINFWKDGGWSYTDHKIYDQNIVAQVEIQDHLKKERLIIAYKNGKIVQLTPYEIIKPKNSKGKRDPKKKNNIYNTGWNTESEILKVFCMNKKDLLLFTSFDEKNRKHVKIHETEDIELYDKISIQGNKIINDNLNATIDNVEVIPVDCTRMLDSLFVKKSARTASLGIRWNNREYVETIANLESILKRLRKRPNTAAA